MLVLTRTAYDDIIDHALAGTPAEVCGILGGSHGNDRSHVERVERTENVADRPRTTYEIGAEQQLRTMEAIEDAGLDVAGFYHSHPTGPPEPSGTDAARATWPGHSYVIVVLDGTHPYVGVAALA